MGKKKYLISEQDFSNLLIQALMGGGKDNLLGDIFKNLGKNTSQGGSTFQGGFTPNSTEEFPTLNLNNPMEYETYKQIADSALKTFETQKIMSVINNDTINDEEKIKIFQESFNKLTEVTINLVQNSVYMVESTAGTTDNQQHIQEFLNNIDKEIFNKIQTHLDDLKNRNEIKPIVIDTPQEYKDRGYQNDTIEIPLVFNPSTFFA